MLGGEILILCVLKVSDGLIITLAMNNSYQYHGQTKNKSYLLQEIKIFNYTLQKYLITIIILLKKYL